MSQKINIRERRYNGVDYDIMHPQTNINMVLDSGNNSVGDVSGALYGDGNGNIVGAAISNPNLLDNSWFTINQRGFTTGQTTGFCADRWQMTYGTNVGTASISSSGLTLTPSASGDYVEIFQKAENPGRLNGEILTFSLLLSDGTVITGTKEDFNENTSKQFINTGNIVTWYNGGQKTFRVITYSEITIRAVKLELGSVSTLANDVAPNNDLERLKCQSHLYMIKATEAYARIGLGYAGAATVLVVINLPIPLKSNTPIAALSGTVTLTGGGVTTTATAVNCLYRTANQLTLAFTPSATIPVGSCCDVYLNVANDYISVSAEL